MKLKKDAIIKASFLISSLYTKGAALPPHRVSLIILAQILNRRHLEKHKPVQPPPQTFHVGVSVLDSPAFNVIVDGIDPDCNSMSDDGGASPLALADMVNVAVTL